MSASPVTILIADDSASDRSVARAVLEEAGYTVVEAEDGQQALELFRRLRNPPPALVMLDVMMPRIDGLEACRLIKSQTPRYLPVLMVSSRNSVQDRVSGLRSGADDFVGKPYDPEELRARIEVLLRTRAAFEEKLAEAESATQGPFAGSSSGGDGGRRGLHFGERSHTPMSPEAFHERMDREFTQAESRSDPLACLLVEIDPNNDASENPGLTALRAESVRAVIANSIRRIDLVNPRGTRGFILLLPNTHFPGALTVAERIARGVRLRSRKVDDGPPYSVSIGISFYPNRDTRSLGDMLGLVDAALERAQHEGGGKICLFQHQGYLYAPVDD